MKKPEGRVTVLLDKQLKRLEIYIAAFPEMDLNWFLADIYYDTFVNDVLSEFLYICN